MQTIQLTWLRQPTNVTSKLKSGNTSKKKEAREQFSLLKNFDKASHSFLNKYLKELNQTNQVTK